MLNIPSNQTHTFNLDPVAEGALESQDQVRENRAKGTGLRKTPGHSGSGSNSPSRSPTTAIKPKPKPGQAVDNSGWPLNKAGQRVDDNGHAIDKKGRRINERDQLINDKGHAVNEKNQRINERNQLVNDKGHAINTLGKPVDSQNRLVDSHDRLINTQGRLVNERKQLIDLDGKPVNKEGYLIDKIGRPLDKDGKVATSKESAVLGNNEPHEQIAGMKKSLTRAPAFDATQTAAPATPKPSVQDSADSATKTAGLIKKGLIPSKPELVKTAIDGAVSNSAGALATLPIKVAETAATTATAEAIKARYLPVPLTPAAPAPAPTTGGQAAPLTEAEKAKKADDDKKQQVLNSAIDNVQVSAFEMDHALTTLVNGEVDVELVPGENWPTAPLERLDKLEELVSDLELKAAETADKYHVYFKAYLPEKDAASGTDGIEARVDTLEKRLVNVKQMRTDAEAKLDKKA
ncbi:hypothetical protein [Pseudomonas antarctica]|uniref:hypothetical protein n=1 Tax=Pseudomonas antarctica TaxID=219572 RepID=UPI003F74C8CC